MIRPTFPALAILAALAAGPLRAQDSGAGGLERLGRDADRALQGLAERLLPHLEALRERLQDLDQYEPPEVLPNGDIIIRRKRPGPESDPRSAPGRPPGTGTET
ncbi:MAG TPA: hypothetical protein VFR34_10745 [Paracoccaceae bacterium]|nr:hypothetical protein [Paracoccaceae bacterium]